MQDIDCYDLKECTGECEGCDIPTRKPCDAKDFEPDSECCAVCYGRGKRIAELQELLGELVGKALAIFSLME